jgi:hypothetical protein
MYERVVRNSTGLMYIRWQGGGTCVECQDDECLLVLPTAGRRLDRLLCPTDRRFIAFNGH